MNAKTRKQIGNIIKRIRSSEARDDIVPDLEEIISAEQEKYDNLQDTPLADSEMAYNIDSAIEELNDALSELEGDFPLAAADTLENI